MLRALVQSGDLVQTRRGVYATRKAVEESERNSRARHAYLVKSAVAVVGADAVACGSSAVLIHDLDMLTDPPADVVTLLRPNAWKRNRKPTDHTIFRAGTLVPDGDPERLHVIESYGVRVTSTPRTVVDLARELPFLDGVIVADSALRKYGFWKKDYLRILHSCRGWAGVEKAREVIRFGDPKADSPLESILRVRLREWGFDPPQTQVRLPLEPGLVKVDFYYEKYRTVIEADGKGKMKEQGYNYRRQRRDEWLRAGGFKIVHVTWEELFDAHPERVISRIRMAFAAPSSF